MNCFNWVLRRETSRERCTKNTKEAIVLSLMNYVWEKHHNIYNQNPNYCSNGCIGGKHYNKYLQSQYCVLVSSTSLLSSASDQQPFYTNLRFTAIDIISSQPLLNIQIMRDYLNQYYPHHEAKINRSSSRGNIYYENNIEPCGLGFPDGSKIKASISNLSPF